MNIIKKQIAPDLFEVGLKCSECSTGFLVHYGTPLKTNPKQWQHKCNACGFIDDYISKPFSYLEYKGKEFGPMDAISYEIEPHHTTNGNDLRALAQEKE